MPPTTIGLASSGDDNHMYATIVRVACGRYGVQWCGVVSGCAMHDACTYMIMPVGSVGCVKW